LATQFPREFLQNPALPLLLLEQPDFLQTLSGPPLERVLREPSAPDYLLRWAAEHPSDRIRAQLLANPALPSSLFFLLLGDPNSSIRSRALRHPHAASVLTYFVQAGCSHTLQEVLAPGPASPEMLARLAEGGLFAKLLAAQHPQTPPDCLRELARHCQPSSTETFDPSTIHVQPVQVREALALNPSTPEDVISGLALDRSEICRSASARHPHMSPAWLAWLVRAGSSPTLLGLGPYDLALSAEELEALAERGWWGKALAARHPNISRAWLDRALAAVPSHHMEPGFALYLAQNEALNAADLTLLHSKRSNSYARDLVAANITAMIAQHRNTPPPLLARLLDHGQERVYRAAAQNPSTPTDALRDALLRIDHRKLRPFLAQNPSAPAEEVALLRRLGASFTPGQADDPCPADLSPEDVARALSLGGFARFLAARSPALSPHEQTALSQDREMWIQASLAQNPALIPALAEQLAGKALWVRESLATNPKLAPALLERLSRDEEDIVRWACARNLSTPRVALRRLASPTENEKVCASAGATLRALGERV
jgi:hypothetical protein